MVAALLVRCARPGVCLALAFASTVAVSRVSELLVLLAVVAVVGAAVSLS